MKNVLISALAMFLGFAGFAQEKVVADKIVGIVGDKIVLKSEIFIANEDIKRQGGIGAKRLCNPRWHAHAKGARVAGGKRFYPGNRR